MSAKELGRKGVQRAMCCPCGRARTLALGLCATCYTLKRQDEEHFAGLREAVLIRDRRMCRCCNASGLYKRSIVVHHRIPGRSTMKLMISLCPRCHARVHRTGVKRKEMSELLRTLWLEQHPGAPEQLEMFAG